MFISSNAASVVPNLYFRSEEIPEEVYQRMEGVSIHDGCPVGMDDLRYVTVLHYTPAGSTETGHLVVNRDVADDILYIFRALYDAKYSIERISLIDDFDGDDNASMAANNTSAFCDRPATGSRRPSVHSYGRAIDLNPLYNPYVKHSGTTTTVLPPQGAPYADRSQDFPMKLTPDDLAVRLFKSRGWRWGGDWHSVKDYQHFEKR